MQPTLHTSRDAPTFSPPRSTSGAEYHRVPPPTEGNPSVLAIPRSDITMAPFDENSIFDGFKSYHQQQGAPGKNSRVITALPNDGHLTHIMNHAVSMKMHQSSQNVANNGRHMPTAKRVRRPSQHRRQGHTAPLMHDHNVLSISVPHSCCAYVWMPR